jgi:hypothetical protein
VEKAKPERIVLYSQDRTEAEKDVSSLAWLKKPVIELA